MKKIVAFLCFFTIASLTMQAQNMRFGFQLSPTFGWMSANSNRINPSGTNLGLKLGMVGEYYFQDNYALTGGLGFHFNAGGTLLYERAGNFWSNSDLPEACKLQPAQAKLKHSIQFVEIPIGLKMRTREFGYTRYFFEPNLGFGFRTQAIGDIVGATDDCQDVNIREDVNLLNLFWGLNAGIEYGISESTALVGGLGLQFGFSDITRDKGNFIDSDNDGTPESEEDSKGIVRALVIRLGVMF